MIGAQAIVFAGARIGAGSIVADQAFVRERTTIGPDTVVGRATGVDNDVTIGARVRIQSQAYVTAYSVIEDDVFFGPCAMTTNDDTMARHPKGMPLRGATLRRACRIGGGAVLVPGVEIGEEAFVAAGAVVTADVPRAQGRHGRAGAARARRARGGPARALGLRRPARRRGYAAAAPAVTASCGASCIQMICSRPGPTPTSTIGTLTASAMKSR